MTKLQKAGLVALIVAVGVYMKIALFPSDTPLIGQEQSQQEEVQAETQVQESEKKYLNIYFIGQNEQKEEYYKAVKREFDEDMGSSKLAYAVQSLVAGPTLYERQRGLYSEIPSGTKILAITETPEKIIIDLSSSFEMGGGTDGLYKRIFQLIKTVKLNTNKPVYLYLDGKQAEVIGGEGIMITQPLSERSFDE